MKDTGAGKLSVVATPIGNLEDITLRALRILKEADVVACEDTRMTKKLLTHFDIHTPTTSFSAQSGERGFEKIIALLQEGKHVALVSDAGTPGVSDPGLELVSKVREKGFLPQRSSDLLRTAYVSGPEARPFASENFFPAKIEVVPGPSALAAALSVSGLRAASFTFYGFLPLKKGRETVFKEIANSERASVFYESPHRIMKALESLQKFLNDPSFTEATQGKPRRVGVFRELTKIYEEHVVGSIDEVLEHFKTNPDRIRGEFVVIVEGLGA